MARDVNRCGAPTETTGAPCQRRTAPGAHCIHHGGAPNPLTAVLDAWREVHVEVIERRGEQPETVIYGADRLVAALEALAGEPSPAPLLRAVL